MIFGITGGYGSGKASAARYFEERGFIHVSLSDMIRDEADNRGIARTRDNLISLGNELRSTYGNGVLALRALEKFKAGKNYVVSSIRHTGEVSALQFRTDFFLVFVDAPAHIRFARIQDRRKEDITLERVEDLLAKEKQESQTNGPAQQLGLVKKLARYVVVNDQTQEVLIQKLNKLHADLLSLN